MNLKQQLCEYIRACFCGIWIESHEHQEAITEIAELCREQEWQLATWNIESGLSVPGTASVETNSDPLAAIRSVNALATPGGTAVLVLENFHRFMQSAEIVQALVHQIIAGKKNRTIIIVLAPVVQTENTGSVNHTFARRYNNLSANRSVAITCSFAR